jgi:hypothetical protein
MALLCGGCDDNIIQLLGRWNGASMLRYLHQEAEPIMRNLAAKMFDHSFCSNVNDYNTSNICAGFAGFLFPPATSVAPTHVFQWQTLLGRQGGTPSLGFQASAWSTPITRLRRLGVLQPNKRLRVGDTSQI